jgi:hypothetical protein
MQHRLKHRTEQLTNQAAPKKHEHHLENYQRPQTQPERPQTDIIPPKQYLKQLPSQINTNSFIVEPPPAKVGTTSLAVQLHHAGIAGRSLALPPLAPPALGPGTLDSDVSDERLGPQNRLARVIVAPPSCPESDSESGFGQKYATTPTTTTISSRANTSSTTNSVNKLFQSQLASLLLLAPNDDNSASLALHGDFDTVTEIDVNFDLHQPQQQLLLHLQHLQQHQPHFLAAVTAAAQDTAISPSRNHQDRQLQRIITTATGTGAMPPSAVLDPTTGGTGVYLPHFLSSSF